MENCCSISIDTVRVENLVYIVDNIKWSSSTIYINQKRTCRDILLVNIDEKSIEKYGQYHFQRCLCRHIMGNTLKYTCIQYIIPEEDRFGQDEYFANGLQNRLTVLSSAQLRKREGNPYVNTSVLEMVHQEHVWQFDGLVGFAVLTRFCIWHGCHSCDISAVC